MRILPAFSRTALLCGISASLFFGMIRWANAQDVISIGVEETSYLPHYQFADGVYKGFAGDLLAKFAEDRRYRLDYRPMPVIRLFAALVDGAIDLKYPDNPLWSSSVKSGRDIRYSDPVAAYIDGVSVLPANLGRGPDSIQTLGMVLGFTAYEWSDRITAKKVTLQETRSFENLARMAQAGRVDGAYGNVAVLAHILATQTGTPGSLVFDRSLPHSAGDYQFSTLKRPTLIAEINEWMRANAAWIATLKRAHSIDG